MAKIISTLTAQPLNFLKLTIISASLKFLHEDKNHFSANIVKMRPTKIIHVYCTKRFQKDVLFFRTDVCSSSRCCTLTTLQSRFYSGLSQCFPTFFNLGNLPKTFHRIPLKVESN